MSSLAITRSPDSLNRLIARLHEIPGQQKKIRKLVDEAFDQDRLLKITLSQQRDSLIEECRQVEYASDPSTIDIDKMQNAVLSSKTLLGENPTKFRNMYGKMHDQIEDCRKAISESEHDQHLKHLEIEKKREQIRICRDKADSLKRNADELDRCSRELIERATYLKEMVEKGTIGTITNFFRVAVGVVLAPFTGGASLIISAAAAGVHLAVDFDSEIDCRRNAEYLGSSARSKLAEVLCLGSIICGTEREIKSLEDEVKTLEKQVDALQEIADTMESIETFLRNSAKATGHVIEAILATERILTEALNSGRDFQRAQRALDRSHRDRRPKAKLWTLRQFNTLKECWGKLKIAMTGALSIQ